MSRVVLREGRAQVLCLVAGLLQFTIFGGAPVWRWSNPRPHGNNVVDLGFRGNLVWQVGDRGQIYTSDDLDAWQPRPSGTTKSLRSITFFGGEAYISGAEGTIVHGPTADALSTYSIGTTDWLEATAASTNRLVAVGDNGAIYSSGNGRDWTRQGSYTNWFRGVAHGNGSFVAVGEDGFIIFSSDGENWRQRNSSTLQHLNRVAFVNDRFWVVGDQGTVLTNDPAFDFVKLGLTITNDLSAVAGNTSEVVVSGDLAVYLYDLASGSWSAQADASNPDLAPLWPYFSAIWDGRLFLLGGRTGMKVEGFRTNAFSPLIWSTDPQISRSWLWSVTRTPEFYVASGDKGTILTSFDGVEWDREAVPDAVLGEVLLGVSGDTNALISVGTKGMMIYSPNVSSNYVTTNGLELVTNSVSLYGVLWNSVLVSPTTNDLQGITVGGGLYVSVGAAGTVLTSTDGSNWVRRLAPVNTYLSSVTTWPQGFVAVGDFGVALTSADGINWQKRNAGVTNWVYAVRYLGEKLVAVGEAGLILTSDNGTDWIRRSSGTTRWLNDITYATNTWFIAANHGLVLSSTNASDWEIHETATSRSLYSITTDGDQLLGVGIEGVILRSRLTPVLTPVNFLSFSHTNSVSAFLFEGETDQRFRLESTGSLDSPDAPWQREETLEVLSAEGTLIHRAEETNSTKFYRTRLLP